MKKSELKTLIKAILQQFKKDLAAKYRVPVESVITYDEMIETPESPEEGKYNVIVRPVMVM